MNGQGHTVENTNVNSSDGDLMDIDDDRINEVLNGKDKRRIILVSFLSQYYQQVIVDAEVDAFVKPFEFYVYSQSQFERIWMYVETMIKLSCYTESSGYKTKDSKSEIEFLNYVRKVKTNMYLILLMYNGVCDGISELIRLCGMYELGCLPDAAAAHLCHDTIVK